MKRFAIFFFEEFSVETHAFKNKLRIIQHCFAVHHSPRDLMFKKELKKNEAESTAISD